MSGYKQLRLQLAFRQSDADHLEAYNYLQSLQHRSDIIVDLILKEKRRRQALDEQAQVEIQAAKPTGVPLDYAQLVDLLRPELAQMVEASVRQAIANNKLSADAANTPPSREPNSEPEPEHKPEQPDLSLALKGLQAFGVD